MNDSRILYEAFNIYYANGMKALEENRLEAARRNLLSASESILKLAKVSTGALLSERIRRAEDIYGVIRKIDQ